MKTCVFTLPLAGVRRLAHLLTVLLLLPTLVTHAQAPSWAGVTATTFPQAPGTSVILAVATDASGNVLVTGTFTGQVTLGSIRLTSVGGQDLFVAKYVPSSDTWVWAQSGGGTGNDVGRGVAVSGTSVYVTGNFANNTTNARRVLFGSTGTIPGTVQVNGATNTVSDDLLLIKYTDNGNTSTLSWTQVGGGTNDDESASVAVSGTSVYVTGAISNSTANTSQVLFGGTGTTPGTVPQYGASSANSRDLVLAKYTDNGSSATLGWTQIAGGTGYTDVGRSVAVSGTSVYVTGAISNSTANTNQVLFGGTGTTPGTVPQYGATYAYSDDLVLAKYTDNGSSATLGWTQIAGGTDGDYGTGVAVSGTSVYVTGVIVNNTANGGGVLFGGTGTTRGTVTQYGATSIYNSDLVLAKYTDNGTSATLGWTQVGGGTNSDHGTGVAVSGTSIYVTGYLVNNTANVHGELFGGTGTTPGTVPVNGVSSTDSADLLLAKYTDNGATATLGWVQLGGGPGEDYGDGIAVSGQNVLVGGSVAASASFSSQAVLAPTGSDTAVLARLVDTSLTPLAVRGGALSGASGLALYPNPASAGAFTLASAGPGAMVRVVDALGQVVATTRTDPRGAATVSGLRPGLYVVQAGTESRRLAVE